MLVATLLSDTCSPWLRTDLLPMSPTLTTQVEILSREKIVLKVCRFQHHSHVESINNNFCWFLFVSVESIDVNVKINLLYNLVMRLSQLMVWRSWFTPPLYPSLRPRLLLQPMKKHCSDNRLSDSQTQRLPPDYLLRMRLLLECL